MRTYFLPPFLAPPAGFSAALVEAGAAFGLLSVFFFIWIYLWAKAEHPSANCNLGRVMPLGK